MKVALICIAKNEDKYIDQWLTYHFSIGIDDIFIYQNDWRYNGIFIKNKNLHLIQHDGKIQQLNAYNNFINTEYCNYNFGIFIDCDQFICLKQHNNIKQFLQNYKDVPGIGINWRNFGDSHLVFNNNYSLINRFNLCEKKLNKHIKTILNFNICKNIPRFYNPHCVFPNNIIVNVEKTKIINGPFCQNQQNQIIQLNHYRKTIQEMKLRKINGYPDQVMTEQKIKISIKNHIEESKTFNQIQDQTLIEFCKQHKIIV